MKDHNNIATAFALTASLAGGAAPDVLAPQHEQHAQVQEVAPRHGENALGSTAMGPHTTDPNLISTTVSPDGQTRTNVRRVSQDLDRPYARHFAASPEAHEIPNMSEMGKFTGLVGKVHNDGEKITLVDIKGFASDEAETPKNKRGAASAGIGIHNPENVDLANARAAASKPTAEKIVKDITSEAVPTTLTQGEEVVSPALAPEVEDLAAKHNISAVELARRFNERGQAPATEDVKAALERWKHDRRVDLTVTSTKPENAGQPGTTSDTVPGQTTPGLETIKIPTGAGDKQGEQAQGNREPVVAPPVARTLPNYGEPSRKTKTDMASDPVTYGTLPSQEWTAGGRNAQVPNSQISTKAQGVAMAQRQMQPREFNMGKNNNQARGGNPRGRMSRSHGGNRGLSR